MQISIDSIETRRWLNSLVADQLPYFMMRSINDIAFATRDAGISAMKSKFKQPTPWTLKTLWVDKATDKTNISARVWLNDYGNQEKVLTHQYTGGKRQPRASESRWRRINFMKKDEIWVPGPGAPLDGYGNVKNTFMIQLMSFFATFTDAGYDANMNAETRKKFLASQSGSGESVSFFVSKGPPLSHLAPGIYKRVKYVGTTENGYVVPVLLFVKEGNYKQAINLEDLAAKELATKGQQILDDYMTKALQEKL